MAGRTEPRIQELLVGSSQSDGTAILLDYLDHIPTLLESEERKVATREQIEVSWLSSATAAQLRDFLMSRLMHLGQNPESKICALLQNLWRELRIF